MNIEDEYFKLIRDGIKQIEIRLNKPERKAIKANDTITLTNNKTKERMKALVVKKKEYKDFYELFNDNSPASLGNLTDPSIMESFYTKADIEKYGAVAIYIVPLL